jgi:hypothetical protein
MKKDFLGRELKIGDKVVYMRINYRDFVTGTIHSLGEKKATIIFDASNGRQRKNIQFYNQLIKIEEKK